MQQNMIFKNKENVVLAKQNTKPSCFFLKLPNFVLKFRKLIYISTQEV